MVADRNHGDRIHDIEVAVGELEKIGATSKAWWEEQWRFNDDMRDLEKTVGLIEKRFFVVMVFGQLASSLLLALFVVVAGYYLGVGRGG